MQLAGERGFMISKEEYKEALGLLRFFPLARHLYREWKSMKELLEEVVKAGTKPELTTETKPKHNTKSEDINDSNDESDADENDELDLGKFYTRRTGETIEEYRDRIKKQKPTTKKIKGASDIIEEAKVSHVQSWLIEQEKMEAAQEESKKNVIVSDNAVDRIGNKIKNSQN